MNDVGKNSITSSQLTFFLVGSAIEISQLHLPNDVVKHAGQSGWLAPIIGSLYPLYVVLIAAFLYNRYPELNILELSNRCFGKIIGSILNCIFCFYFLFYTTAVTSGLAYLLITFVVPFLSTFKVATTIVFIAALTSSSGLKVLGRINEVIFYFTLILLAIPFIAIGEGTFLHFFPMFQTNIKNLLKASIETDFATTCYEIIFLIYPFVTDRKRFKKAALWAVWILMVINTWIVFITIYYWGIHMIPKALWSFAAVTKTVEVPVISNFRLIFMVLWSVIVFKTFSNAYFSTTFIIDSYTAKSHITKICFIIFPIISYLSLQYSHEIQRRNFIRFAMPKFILFNLAYITAVAVMSLIKKDVINEKNAEQI